jgi:hypothetical protein
MTTPDGPYRYMTQGGFEEEYRWYEIFHTGNAETVLFDSESADDADKAIQLLNAQHAEIERLQARLFDCDRQWSQIAAVAGGDARHCKSHPKTIAGFVCEEIERLREENARLREATRWRSVDEELPDAN